MVQPDTVLRWHRYLFHWMCRRKSRRRQMHGRLPLTSDIVALITCMARDNRTRGVERIRGELLKPGIRGGKSTIQSPQTGISYDYSAGLTSRSTGAIIQIIRD